MADTQYDVNSPKIALVGFLGSVILFAVVILLAVIFYHLKADQDFRKDVNQPQVELDQLVARQRGILTEYRVLDKEKGVYAIPVSRAMNMIVAERQANPEGPPGIETDTQAAPAKKEPSQPVDTAKEKPAEPQPKGGQP